MNRAGAARGRERGGVACAKNKCTSSQLHVNKVDTFFPARGLAHNSLSVEMLKAAERG